MMYKQPRSIQVVIFAGDGPRRRYLLLRRAGAQGGFWQSVTGSLEGGETHRQAAVREVKEETGISCSESDLIELGLVNKFEIAPEWRPKYPPGVSQNEEVCFALRADGATVTIDPNEHDRYIWVDFEQTLELLYWESNKQAFVATERLLQ